MVRDDLGQLDDLLLLLLPFIFFLLCQPLLGLLFLQFSERVLESCPLLRPFLLSRLEKVVSAATLLCSVIFFEPLHKSRIILHALRGISRADELRYLLP